MFNQPNYRVMAAPYPDGGWRVFHPGTKTLADIAERDDIKFFMAKWICRKTGDPIENVHVLLDVVSASEIVAAENV
ncbi:hypothetical protein [Nocardia sp. NPDC057455]|uniref:hypothetical protein n=1 Tax=Nocardia sp. NPDC057455 TaxID=3346138 RepID=UPI00366E24C1